METFSTAAEAQWIVAAKIQKQSLHSRLAAEVFETRRLVAEAGCVLTSKNLASIQNLFRFVDREVAPAELPILLSPEYGSGEFLACVDSDGEKVLTPPSLVGDFSSFSTAHPGFGSWFRVDQHPTLDRPVLLPARWLCHLLGLRHGIVQLIITVINPELRFLVQVRSMRKKSFPGCFDLPVAGHVDGLQSYEETLRKETREEISLDIDSLMELTSVGSQLDCISIGEDLVNDCEYGRAFSASLDPTLLASLVPQPGELATLALFPLEELQLLHAAFPNSFAPGIQRIFDTYRPE